MRCTPIARRRIPYIWLLALQMSSGLAVALAGCPPNSVQVGQQEERVGNVIIIHPVCQMLSVPRRYDTLVAVPELPRLPPEVSDSSVKTALARARAFLLQKAGDAMFALVSEGDMTLSVMYNATKLPDVIFPKVSEAAAMNADPDTANMSQASNFGNQITVESVRTLFDVGGGQGNEPAGAGQSGSTLFSAFFPKTAAKTEQVAQAAPTWMPDMKRIIGIWAPARTGKDAQ
jgi:hypothetical protein